MGIGGRTFVGSPLKGAAQRSHSVTSKSMDDWARHLRGAADVIESPKPQALAASGEILAQVIENTARRKGVTRFGGARWTGYQSNLRRKGADPLVIVRPRNVGATSTLNSGARPHFIGARGSSRARAVRTQARAAAKAVVGGNSTSVFSLGGETLRLGRSLGRGEARVLVWEGQRHPVAFVNHPGSPGKRFVKPGFDAGSELAFAQWNALVWGEIIRKFT